MPKCALCEQYFKNYRIVDGVRRNMHSRKYCLTCSPFGSRNTKKLKRGEDGEIVKIPPRYFTGPRNRLVPWGTRVQCRECGRQYEYDPRKGHQTELCNSCNANHRRVEVKSRCVAYKGGKCERCGYSRCLRAMHFHHVNGVNKEFTVAKKMSWRWSRVKAELDKCALLCANCHCEVHDEEDKARKAGASPPS